MKFTIASLSEFIIGVQVQGIEYKQEKEGGVIILKLMMTMKILVGWQDGLQIKLMLNM